MKHGENLLKLRNKVKSPVYGAFRHAAGFAKNGNLLNITINRLTSHAETNGLKKLPKGNGKFTMYITRHGNGLFGANSRPCLHCLQAMAECGRIRGVVYSDGQSFVVSTVNKLLRESEQHISAGNLYLMNKGKEEDEDEDEGKSNLA